LPFVCAPQGQSATFLDFPVDSPVKLGTDRLIINPGSVGQPRDGVPSASYSIYDSDTETITHKRAEYDIPATQDKMKERGLPRYLIDRLPHGR
jgi:diadenosine tetraphosphatase ApaH/serine/threonine PP2A family protein phosphatase